MTDKQGNSERSREKPRSATFSEPSLVPLQPATAKDTPNFLLDGEGLPRGAQRLFKDTGTTTLGVLGPAEKPRALQKHPTGFLGRHPGFDKSLRHEHLQPSPARHKAQGRCSAEAWTAILGCHGGLLRPQAS